MFLVNGFIIGSWAPQIPLVLRRLEISEFVLGLLILAFGLGALVAMPWAGWLIGRRGSRAALSGFALVACLGLPAVVAAPGIWTAAAALVAFGGLIGGMDVAMNANAVSVERHMRRAIMSSSHGFWSLGGFAGGGLGGLLIERLGALPHALLVGAVSFVVVLAALRHLIDDDRPQTEEARTGGLPRNPAIYVIGVLALFCMVPEGAVLDWAALYLLQELGASTATAGLAFAAFSGAMALMRFAGDGIRNRFGAVATLRVSALVAAVGMLVAAFAPDNWLAIAAFAFAGLGIANTVPIVFSAAGNFPGLAHGAGMSVATTMGYSGILVAPSAIGFIGGKVGFAPVYVAVGLLLVVVAVLAGFARHADGAETQAIPSAAV